MRGSHDHPSPSLPRGTLIIGLYGALALLGLMISAGRGTPDVFGVTETSLAMALFSVLAGVAIGLVIVALTRLITAHTAWGKTLHRSFADLLGPVTGREIFIIAIASAVGEECFFRGALQPWLGVWLQAAIFALLHIGPARRFVPWTAASFALGVGFGYLARETHNLGGPIVAHFIINYLNLRFIVRTGAVAGAAAPWQGLGSGRQPL